MTFPFFPMQAVHVRTRERTCDCLCVSVRVPQVSLAHEYARDGRMPSSIGEPPPFFSWRPGKADNASTDM